MLTSNRYSQTLSFPRLPEHSVGKDAAAGFSLRPFGEGREDLAIDFNQEVPPYLVTHILQCCTRDSHGEPPDPSFLWDLTIGKRIECLLVIATAGGRSDLIIQPRCANDACRQQMEVELSLAELASEQDRSGNADNTVVEIAGQRLSLRKPTGADQLAWLSSTYPDERAALRAILETLLEPVDGDGASPAQPRPMPDDSIALLNDALDEIDRLISFTLVVRCPDCGDGNQYELDLQELSLGRIEDAQRGLLEAVHRLALNYHWSEGEILDLPPSRRSFYLGLVQEENAS